MGLVANLSNRSANFIGGGERPNFCIMLIGANGSGKTLTEEDIVLWWKQSRPEEDKVVGFLGADNMHTLEKHCDFLIEYEGKGDSWAEDLQSLENSLIILDDYRIIHPEDKIQDQFRNLMINRKNKNLDIIMACHSPIDVLSPLVSYITHYYIFNTQSTKESFSRKMGNARVLNAARVMVNKYVSVFGEGNWKDKSFPHIIVDKKSNLYTQNMKTTTLIQHI